MQIKEHIFASFSKTQRFIEQQYYNENYNDDGNTKNYNYNNNIII